MKSIALCTSLIALAACGSSSTGTSSTRYNFAVVDGRNQAAAAGDATLPNRITSQLTRDPQGKFATRVFDFFAPAVAYAQGLTLSGTPVANAIVCGRVAPIGEPQVVPLCAFTLADGKAANVVQPGTKAGVYDVLFSAQVPSEAPVVDSTKVTVQPGAPDPNYRGSITPYMASPALVPADAVRDVYGNAVPFRVVSDGRITVGDTQAGTDGARTITFDGKIADNVDHIVEMRGANEAIVGHLTYHINLRPDGNPGIYFIASGA